MKAPKPPTTTSLVYDVLQDACNTGQDFVSVPMLMQHTGRAYNQVNAALHHLRAHGAVDLVVEVDGKGWWFLCPETDDRSRTVQERTPEDKPRRKRAQRVTRKVKS